MAANRDMMLRAVHSANPDNMSRRYTQKQLQAAFRGLKGGAATGGRDTMTTDQNVAVGDGINFADERKRVEDAAYASQTQNVERDYNTERANLEQTLYNRGIPLDPTNPAYQNAMNELTGRYDAIKQNARNFATAQGGAEFDRLNAADIARKELELKRRQTNAAIQQMRGIGRGGGGQQQTSSAFSSSPPPGL